MHFKRLALRNFRNFQGDVEVWFTETANAIVGSNGAGKSNILLAIAFVLDCDKKFLDVRNEIHFINEGHMLAEPDLASCTVTLLVHCNDGTDMELEKTLSKEATSFTLNGETVTRSAYNQTVERAGLQGSLHLLPQRLIQQIATSDGRKFAKIFEAFCDNPSKVEFGEESQKQLADCQRNVQQLKQRITTQRKALRSIGCLEHLDPEYRPKLEQEVNECDRMLLLADLWKKEQSIKEVTAKLEELRTYDEEASISSVEDQTHLLESEIADTKGKLENIRQIELRRLLLENEVVSLRKKIERAMEAERIFKELPERADLIKRLPDPHPRRKRGSGSRGSSSSSGELHHSSEHVKISRELVCVISNKLGRFDDVFRRRNKKRAEELDEIEAQLRSFSDKRWKLQLSLSENRDARRNVEQERKAREHQLEVLENRLQSLTEQLNVDHARHERYETTHRSAEEKVRAAEADLDRELAVRNALNEKRHECYVRYILDHIDEYFSEEIPADAVFGLLRDFIEPTENVTRVAFDAVLAPHLNAVVVSDERTQTVCEAALRDSDYVTSLQAPVLLLPEYNAELSGVLSVPSKYAGRAVRFDDVYTLRSKYCNDTVLMQRIRELVRTLTDDPLYCDEDTAEAISMDPDQEVLLKAVTPDGTVCSNWGLVEFSSMHNQGPLISDGDWEEDELEEDELGASWKDVSVFCHAYESLKNKQKLVEYSTRLALDLATKQLQSVKTALSSLQALETGLQDSSEYIREEIAMLEELPELKALRTRRNEINGERLRYIAPYLAAKKLHEADVLKALERTVDESVLDYFDAIETEIEQGEAEQDQKWYLELRSQLEARRESALGRISVEKVRIVQALQNAESELRNVSATAEGEKREKRFLNELLRELQERLVSQRKLQARVSREARSISLKKRNCLKHLRKLHVEMKQAFREWKRLSDSNGDNNGLNASQGDLGEESEPEPEPEPQPELEPEPDDDDDDNDDSTGSELGSELERSCPEIDYSELPSEIRASKGLFAKFVKATKDTAADLRFRLAIAPTRTNSTSWTILSRQRTDKLAILKSYQQQLQQELGKIQAAENIRDEYHRERNEFLKDFLHQMQRQVTKTYNWLSGGRGELTMVMQVPSENRYYESTISFVCHIRTSSIPLNFESLSSGEKTLVSVAILITAQHILGCPLMIYDEIDARLSGTNASLLGEALNELATNLQQVICASHRPMMLANLQPAYSGVFFCPVSKTAKVISFDPNVECSEDDLTFEGTLSSEIIEFLSAPPLREASSRSSRSTGSSEESGDAGAGSPTL